MKMHMCRVHVALAGDIRHVVVLDHMDAVSRPEVEVLRAIHGDNGIQSVEVIGSRETDPVAEKARLMQKYAPEIVEGLYPGFQPAMPMTHAGATEPAAPTPPRRGRKPKVGGPVETSDELSESPFEGAEG